MKCSDVNAWLDMLMDDELSDEMRVELENHARVCPACAENINATIEMKKLLSEMDDEVDVPLQAQAAWRKAVRQEAARSRAKRIYRSITAVAAAVVVLVGIGISVGNGNIDPVNQNDVMQAAMDFEESAAEDTLSTTGIAVIESDGTDISIARIMPEPGPTVANAMTECVLCVENIDSACGYISDLVAEYEGNIDEQRVETTKANLYITLPAENVGEFLSASSHLDISGQTFDSVQISNGDTAMLLMILNG